MVRSVHCIGATARPQFFFNGTARTLSNFKVHKQPMFLSPRYVILGCISEFLVNLARLKLRLFWYIAPLIYNFRIWGVALYQRKNGKFLYI